MSEVRLNGSPMRIRLITPPGTRQIGGGNLATAQRWAALLQPQGYEVVIDDSYQGEATDLMIALHAWKSAKAIADYRKAHPSGPLIVALTGTDIYKYQQSEPEVTQGSMALANVLIGLHERVVDDIDPAFADKLQVVLQSAMAPAVTEVARSSEFDICQIGHLRWEKDPFRVAEAVRTLPPDSGLQVVHAGGAHTEDWARQAEQEQTRNHRFHWLGPLQHQAVWELMARCRAMVISSHSEGGANVVSEACVAGLPVIASRIPGNLGLLGTAYPGYFPPGDTRALRELLLRLEKDAQFLHQLGQWCAGRASAFSPQAERQSLEKAIRRCLRPD